MPDWLKSLFAGRTPPPAPAVSRPPPLASLEDLEALIDRCGLSAAKAPILAEGRISEAHDAVTQD